MKLLSLLKDKYLLDVMFLACAFCFISETYLSWDASYQLFSILNKGEFFYIENRPFVFLMQLPVYLLLKVSNGFDLVIYKKVYGLTYAFYPFIISLIGYYIHKFDRKRFHFLVLSISLGSMLFQYHQLFEHLIACQFYMLILSITGIKKYKNIEALLLVVLNLIHPVSLPLTGLHFLLNFFLDKKDITRWFFPLVLAITRIGLFLSTKSETSYFSLDNFYYTFFLQIKNFYSPRDLIALLLICVNLIYLSLFLNKAKFAYALTFGVFITFIFWYNSDPIAVEVMYDMHYIVFLFFLAPISLVYKTVKSEDIELLKTAFLCTSLYLFSAVTYGVGYQSFLSKLAQNIERHEAKCVEELMLTLPKVNRTRWKWTTLFEYYMYRNSAVIYKVIIPHTCFGIDKKNIELQKFINSKILKGYYFKLNL